MLSIERSLFEGSVVIPEASRTRASYTEPPPVLTGARRSRYRHPRHYIEVEAPDGTRTRVLTKTGKAGAIAQLVRERLYLPHGTKSAPLRSLMIQTFKLFKRGYDYDELRLAIEEAATAPWRRKHPSRDFNLVLFIRGWVEQLRRRGPREDTMRRERTRENELDKAALECIQAFCSLPLGRLCVAPPG